MSTPAARSSTPQQIRRVARALAALGLLALATFVVTQSWPLIGIAVVGGPDDEMGLLVAFSVVAVLVWAALLWASAAAYGIRGSRHGAVVTVALVAASLLWVWVAVATGPLPATTLDDDATMLRFFASTGGTLPAACVFFLASAVIWLTARD